MAEHKLRLQQIQTYRAGSHIEKRRALKLEKKLKFGAISNIQTNNRRHNVYQN